MKRCRYYWKALDSEYSGFANTINDCVLQANGKSRHFEVMYNKSRKVIREYVYKHLQ